MENRKSNFELLKIVSILMVILLHYNNSRMGGALGNVIKGSFNYYLVNFTESLCIIAVNLFVLITGYFSYKKDKIKVSKVINLFYQCIIYGILIYFILVLFDKIVINKASLLKLRDTIFDRWFILIYSILYLLIPYINKIISSINKNQYKVLILISTIFFYIWPTIYKNTTIKDSGYGIVNFITLYFIGAYIAKYQDKKIHKYITIPVYILCAIITTYLACNTKINAYAYNQIFNLIGAVSLFLTFKNINIGSNKIINKLASYTLSTYIIHENSLLVSILYKNIFLTTKFYHRKLIIVNMSYTVLGIFIMCVLIEYIRRLLMKKIDKGIDKIKLEIKAGD